MEKCHSSRHQEPKQGGRVLQFRLQEVVCLMRNIRSLKCMGVGRETDHS